MLRRRNITLEDSQKVALLPVDLECALYRTATDMEEYSNVGTFGMRLANIIKNANGKTLE